MPKELTHWQVARRAYHGLKSGSVERIISANPELYYMGSVAHDIPFYDLSLPEEANLARLGNQMHGVNGENTIVPLASLVSRILSNPKRKYLLSFMLGMLTHYITDSTFHPMVYYFSGNYFAEDSAEKAKAVFRHRLLETGIDLWLETWEPLDYPHSLAGLWWKSGVQGREALDLLSDYYVLSGDKGVKAHFRAAWRNHRIFQLAFKWSVPWYALRLYRTLGHPGAEKLEALFYPQHLNLSFFHKNLEWRHPVTGEEHQSNLKDLLYESLRKIKALYIELDANPVLRWPEIMRTWPPLSLDSGLAYVPVKDMKYFAGKPIETELKTTL